MIEVASSETFILVDISGMATCPPLSSIMANVPGVLWNATQPLPTLTLQIGSTFSFTCPDGLQVSFNLWLLIKISVRSLVLKLGVSPNFESKKKIS
jgi:hypothetical protein